jgi:hypothetical protein
MAVLVLVRLILELLLPELARLTKVMPEAQLPDLLRPVVAEEREA